MNVINKASYVFWQNKFDHNDDSVFWDNIVKNITDPEIEIVIFDNELFILKKNTLFKSIHSPRSNSTNLGHGGRKFVVCFLATGNIVVTDNLWYIADIPENYRHLLKDNAFVIN